MDEPLESTVDLKFAAAPGASVDINFEPVGTTFKLVDGDYIYLRALRELVGQIEFVVWPTGVGVWVPYPGDYVVLSSEGVELDRL